ncbi:hypothetical protein [Aeromicrobium wangtongii]|uniref:hypothetical protein n=1 Tax=Aeromicrobium wangtongii TaxID=2969247 RepID=UPI002017055A|nr:hypothetical protein [Aeromicrobium wangtongii]MCL3818731.1 hypothetical protein [Aeromicrobium wangtongii]
MLDIVLIVLIGLLLGVGALVIVGLVRFRSVRARHRRRIAAVEPEHSEPASLVGVASEGRTQARGVGTLAVGPSHLLFVQLAPEREILIPRDAITSARATRHFLGKTTGADMLVVTWDVQGMTDAVALAVPDVGAWRDRLA